MENMKKIIGRYRTHDGRTYLIEADGWLRPCTDAQYEAAPRGRVPIASEFSEEGLQCEHA